MSLSANTHRRMNTLNDLLPSSTFQVPSKRKVVHRTRGYRHGPITRLMSPSDLGERLKPFVFLDLFEADMRGLAGSMPVHPHSGLSLPASAYPRSNSRS